MGEAINHYFESIICWCIDLGTFYLSGRDIVCMIIGFVACLVLWAVFDGKELNVRGHEDKDIS